MFVQANGFATADQALKEGTVEGLRYLGADHYWSNDHTSGHVFAGVKKIERTGILRTTYGRAHTIEFPAGSSNNNLSGEKSPLLKEILVEKRGENGETLMGQYRAKLRKIGEGVETILYGVANLFEDFAKCLAPKWVMI